MTHMRSSYCPQTGSITLEIRYSSTCIIQSLGLVICTIVLVHLRSRRGPGTFTASNLDENDIIRPGRVHYIMIITDTVAMHGMNAYRYYGGDWRSTEAIYYY